jgi:ADP-ribosylglycohydrolase
MERNLTEDEKKLLDKLKRDHEKAPKANFTNLRKFTEPAPNAAVWGEHYEKVAYKTSFNDKIIGTLFGAAIGDAIGHPLEFVRSFEEIHNKYGRKGVQGFTLFWENEGKRYAPYTDDFQMAEIVLKALIWQKKNNATLDQTMDKIANGFVQWSISPQGGHRSPGNACLSACKKLKRGVHWSEAGEKDAGGCGSVMRAWPFGLIFYYDKEKAKEWSVTHSKITHGDPIALAACAALSVGIITALNNNDMNAVLNDMISTAKDFCTKTSGMMEAAVSDAEKGILPNVTLQRLQGWAAHEAIAAACYIFSRHANDFSLATLEAANTPGDSDSIATIVGALCGAFNGIGKIPHDWIADVERSDDLHEISNVLIDVVMSC